MTYQTTTKRVAVITGGAKGIGSELVRCFCRKGYRVFFSYRSSRDAAQALCNELTSAGFEVASVYADLSNAGGADALLSAITESGSRVDVLVNNVGSALYSLLPCVSDEDVMRCLSDNLLSCISVCRAFYDVFVGQKQGSIINISSVWGLSGASMETVYSAAKAGIVGFTKALAKELAPSDIRVNAIAPGVIKTDMLAQFSAEELRDIISNIPLARLGSQADIAEAAAFLASDCASYITGQTINVSGGFVY